MKLMLAAAFVIALGAVALSARPLAASTFATHVADASGVGPGSSVRPIDTAGSSTFPCRQSSEMLTHGLTQGSIAAARVTVAASLASWCSQQLDAPSEVGRDIAATVEPPSLVADPVDESTGVEDQPRLIPRHAGQCGGELL